MRLKQLPAVFPASFVFLCFVAPIFADTATPDSATLSFKSKQDLAQLTTELKSGEGTQVGQALAVIDQWISQGHVPAEIYHDWIPALMNGQDYQQAADLALAGALARPQIRFITPLMLLRTRALLALGDSDLALQAAKGYYNVCYMKNTNNAIQLVAQCFAEVHLEDDGIAQRFINEQNVAAGATADSSTTQPAAPMLKTVEIDQTLYTDALNKWKARTVLMGDFDDYASYANLLLIADQPDPALKIFETLYKQATTQDELNEAIEGIARCMRAQDGNVGRANAWLLSLQKQSSTPAAAPQ